MSQYRGPALLNVHTLAYRSGKPKGELPSPNCCALSRPQHVLCPAVLHCFLDLAGFSPRGVVDTEGGLLQPPTPPPFNLERLENEKLHFPEPLAARVLEVNRILSVIP